MTTIRRPGAVSATVLVTLACSLATAHAIAPEWSRNAGLDVWNLPSLEREFVAAREARDDTDAAAERAAKRRETANLIALRLVDGLPLATAVDEILEVFRNDRGMIASLESQFPNAPTVRHLFARHTIHRIERLLEADPVHCQRMVERLELEYQTLELVPGSPQLR